MCNNAFLILERLETGGIVEPNSFKELVKHGIFSTKIQKYKDVYNWYRIKIKKGLSVSQAVTETADDFGIKSERDVYKIKKMFE